jgi:sugar/nucleoside kinase (ribokinase family)
VNRYVIAVGGANGERFLRLTSGGFQLGRKYTAPSSETLPGGSGVNYTCRLLAAGADVLPILPIADDLTGRVIVEAIESAARTGAATADLRHAFVDDPAAATPYSTILASPEQRTVFNEFSPEMLTAFREHIVRKLADLPQDDGKSPAALVIGHIHADRAPDAGSPGAAGQITESLIHYARQQGIPVFLNPGSAQYGLGVARWEALLPEVDCLQMDIHEMRAFVAELGITRLYDALAWFGERCTTVITLERAGAVARLRGSDSAVISWPFSLSSREVVDPTGAGDACMAGLVASALERPIDREEGLLEAVKTGMLWAARACTQIGGAAACPSREQLRMFGEEHPDLYHTELRRLDDEARPLLRLLDRIFPVAGAANERAPSHE